MINLEEGQVSDPVKTQFGWHVIKLLTKTAATVQAVDDIKEQLLSDYSTDQRLKANQQYLETLQSEYTVVIDPFEDNLPTEASQ